MTTLLSDLFDLALLDQMVEEGYIRVQTHPEHADLRLLNYSEKTQFERKWNDVTRISRGLIYDQATLEVLARPFSKIHNWNEAEAPRITENAPLYSWSNKWDGSLGIVYPLPDGTLSVATRGSFVSEQAIKASNMLHHSAELMFDSIVAISSGYTPLFEIVFPDNRIVVSYGDAEALIPLGSIAIADGAYVPDPSFDFTVKTFYELVMDLSRPNAEGWVAWLSPYKAVKIKQAGYVELHRIVTGLNRKAVWRTLRDGTFRENVVHLPDELYKWAEEVAAELLREHAAIKQEALDWKRAVVSALPMPTYERKDKALWIIKNIENPAMRGLVFLLLDGQSLDEKVWTMIEPRGDSKE